MNRSCWWLAEKLSRLLEPVEREAVLGDLAESGETGAQALLGLLGLALRRQAGAWMHWRPWVAVIALALPAALLLSLASARIANVAGLSSWMLWNYKDLDPVLLAENHLSLRHALTQAIRGALVLAAAALSCGFLLGAVSRGAAWINGMLFGVVFLLGSLTRALHVESIGFSTCASLGLVLFAAYWGMLLSRRPAMGRTPRTMLWVASVVTAVAVRYSFWWPHTRFYDLLLLVAYAPLAYLAIAAV